MPSLGQRFFLVRQACGDGLRKPEPIRAFVDRVLDKTGIVIHSSELSEIENDKPSKSVTVEHVTAVAAVDPLRRGKLWLGWGEAVDSTRSMGDADLERTTGATFTKRQSVAEFTQKKKTATKKAAVAGKKGKGR